MRLVYAAPARDDLIEILQFVAAEYPAAYDGFVTRLRMIEHRLQRWPMSGQCVAGHEDVRTVMFTRYPYRVFYRVGGDAVEILHIRHAAREWPM